MLEKVVGLKTKLACQRQLASKVKSIQKNDSIHTTSAMKYPTAPALKIPSNIDQDESSKFSTQRFRELSASSILTHPIRFTELGKMDKFDVTVDNSKTDPHIVSYDCINTIALNSSMQSNVPQPFGGLHNHAIAIAMPGGGYANLDKYQAGKAVDSHYTSLRKEFRQDWYDYTNKDGKKTTE